MPGRCCSPASTKFSRCVCPHCGGEMRIIAFITDGPTVRDILVHLGEPTAPPRIAPARGPPLWEAAGAEHDPSADPLLQPTPAFEFDQRLSLVATTVAARLCATPGGLVPAPARLPARGHLGVGARPEVPRQACGAARCHRKSTLDPPYRLLHTQARAVESPIRSRRHVAIASGRARHRAASARGARQAWHRVLDGAAARPADTMPP